MKKLMVAAAIALVAVCSQAASLKWSCTGANAVDANGNVLTAVPEGYNVVLAYLGTSDNYSYDNAVAVYNTKTSGTGASWDIGEEEGEKYAFASGTFDGSTVGGFANGQVYAAMLQDGDGKLSQIKYADDSLDPVIYTIANYSGSTWSKSFQFATKDYVVGDVPEPTSGLLLLLGVAGLALRRRRA